MAPPLLGPLVTAVVVEAIDEPPSSMRGCARNGGPAESGELRVVRGQKGRERGGGGLLFGSHFRPQMMPKMAAK